MAEAYPLYWPEGWKRTASYARQRSKFKSGFGAARDLLFAELARMGAAKVILSTSIPLRNDGLPRANMRPDGGDTGIAVYFERKTKPMVFACDKFDRSEDNIYAIAKTIDAMRGIERWGASDMMERAFSGFKALPSETAGESWWSILGCEASATRAEGDSAFRKRALEATAADPTGESGAMLKLNLARDQMRGATL